jgi:hypothetical protein
VQFGDVLADAAGFAAFRSWLEARLPRVSQTSEGYFTAALVRLLNSCVTLTRLRGRRLWDGSVQPCLRVG